jgi:murein DD-endopeptidase MepM/ murein hydrolase activator NlpD
VRAFSAAAVALVATVAVTGCSTSSDQAVPSPRPVAQADTPPLPEPVAANFGLGRALTQGGLAIGTVPAGTVALALDGRPIGIAPGGRFLVAFGRDAASSATLIGRTGDGRLLRQQLAITRRSWQIESIPSLVQSGKPDPEYEKLRQSELARIAAARAMKTDAEGWRQAFAWPATGRISGIYGSQRILGGVPRAPHYGVDIARPAGTPVASPADGVVVLAGPPKFSLEGNLLIIDHGMGLNSAFLHLSRVDVKVGDHVRQGQVVGAIGMTGRATGPHLHWAMNLGDVRIDPALLVPPMAGSATATAPVKASGGD